MAGVQLVSCFASRRCSLCLYSWRQLFCFFISTTKHH